jgi:predicted  nucleic acid-binding Zn-ribbon protein
MSEDLTQNWSSRPFEERVLAELSAMRQELSSVNSRLGTLEEKVDARLRETRPVWEAVQARLAGIETELRDLNKQVRTLIADMFKLRVRVETLEDEQPRA